MISLDLHHMGLNSTWNHHIHVAMWNTWDVPRNDTAEHIIGWVAKVAAGAPGGKLKHVVFSCHGAPASIGVGQGIGMADVGRFNVWRGLVEKVWFRCCQVALIPTPTPGVAATNDGNVFCSRIAQAAQCYVVASTELQIGSRGRTLPYGQIDTFEGLVLSYGPAGNVTWSRRYPSGYRLGTSDNWHQNPD